MAAMRYSLGLSVSVAAVILAGSLGLAQPKDAKKLPPINPSQAKLVRTFTGLDGPGFAIASDLNASVVAAACDRSTIQVWHKDTIFGIRAGNDTANIFRGHKGTVTDLAWNGGPVLASAGADKKLVLWKVAGGKMLHELETPFLVRALAMSPDGKFVAGVGDDASVQLWEIETGEPIRKFEGHKDWLRCLAFSPDSKHLAAAGFEGEALLWEVDSGKKIRELPAAPKKKPKTPPDPNPVSQIVFSPDGKTVILGRADGDLDLVRTDTGQKIRTMSGHTSRITGLIWHPANTLIVSSSRDGSLRLWNPANGGLYKTLTDHKAWVEDVGFLAQGTRIASVSADRTVRLWSLTP